MIAAISTTQGWMIGIIAMMIGSDVCALIFTAMGKTRHKN